jgi:hypothetical protein
MGKCFHSSILVACSGHWTGVQSSFHTMHTPGLLLSSFLVQLVVLGSGTNTAPVIGPWATGSTVDVAITWANQSAGLVEVSVGGTRAPLTVTAGGQHLFVIQPPGLPPWALPPSGGGGVCVDVGAGTAYVYMEPTGQLIAMMIDDMGTTMLVPGMQLHWRAFRFRFVPQLRALAPTGVLAPVGLPYLVTRGNDGQTTLSLWTTPWQPATTNVMTELEFASLLLPKSARPTATTRACVAVNTPAWSARCELQLAACGTVTLVCPGGMQNPVLLPAGDRAVTYNGHSTQ